MKEFSSICIEKVLAIDSECNAIVLKCALFSASFAKSNFPNNEQLIFFSEKKS